jgi:hypothetical protein
MSCGGGHLEFSIDIRNIYFVDDLPMIIPKYMFLMGRSSTKFLFLMPIGNPRWPPPQDID